MYAPAADRIVADAARYRRGDIDSATRAFDSFFRPGGTVQVRVTYPLLREDGSVIPVGHQIAMAGDKVADAVALGVVVRI